MHAKQRITASGIELRATENPVASWHSGSSRQRTTKQGISEAELGLEVRLRCAALGELKQIVAPPLNPHP
jgi:hypothetical protein